MNIHQGFDLHDKSNLLIKMTKTLLSETHFLLEPYRNCCLSVKETNIFLKFPHRCVLYLS